MPYIKATPTQVIEAYYANIERTSSYASFYMLRETYPEEFDKFLNPNRKKIVRDIKAMVKNDIYGFLNDGDRFSEYNMDLLFDVDIEEVFNLYKINFTQKDWNRWTRIAERNSPSRTEKEDDHYAVLDDQAPEEESLNINESIDQILPNEHEAEPLTEKEKKELIKEFYPEHYDQIVSIFRQREFLDYLTDDPDQLKAVAEFYLRHAEHAADSKESFIIAFVNDRLNLFFNETESAMIAGWGDYLLGESTCFFKQKKFADYTKNTSFDTSILNRLIDSGLVISNNGWHSFLFGEMLQFFSALHLVNSADKLTIYHDPWIKKPNVNFQLLLPYLYSLDEEDFLAHFIKPQIVEFYEAVNDKDIKKMLWKYYNFFEIIVIYSDNDLQIVGYRYGEMDEIFLYLKIDLLRENTEIFASSYFEDEWDQNADRQNFIAYISEKFKGLEDDVIIAEIEDEVFWDLLSKTDLAKRIWDEVKGLEKWGH